MTLLNPLIKRPSNSDAPDRAIHGDQVDYKIDAILGGICEGVCEAPCGACFC